MEHVRLPFPDRIETLERGHALAGSVQVDGQRLFRRCRDLVGEALCAGPQPGEALRARRDEVPLTQSPADAGALAWVLGCAGARGLLSVPVVVFAAGGQRDRGANIGDTRKKCSAIQRKSSLSLAAGFYRQDAPLPAGCKTTMQALGPERPVELFDERVVGGLPRPGRVQRNNVELGPQTERLLIYTRLSRRTRHLVRAVFPESRQHAG